MLEVYRCVFCRSFDVSLNTENNTVSCNICGKTSKPNKVDFDITNEKNIKNEKLKNKFFNPPQFPAL